MSNNFSEMLYGMGRFGQDAKKSGELSRQAKDEMEKAVELQPVYCGSCKRLMAENAKLKARIEALTVDSISPEFRLAVYETVVESLQKRRDELGRENAKLKARFADICKLADETIGRLRNES